MLYLWGELPCVNSYIDINSKVQVYLCFLLCMNINYTFTDSLDGNMESTPLLPNNFMGKMTLLTKYSLIKQVSR